MSIWTVPSGRPRIEVGDIVLQRELRRVPAEQLAATDLAGEPDAFRRVQQPFPAVPISLHPVVLPPGVYEELHLAAAAVFDALVRVARRLGRDRHERLAALGIGPATAPLFVGDEDWE